MSEVRGGEGTGRVKMSEMGGGGYNGERGMS